MKILHVQKAKGIGGTERHLLSLLPGLTAAGDEVRLLIMAPGQDEGRFVTEAAQAGIETVVETTRMDADPRARTRIRAQIREFDPDIVHTHLVHADLWGQLAARAEGVAGVRSCHDVGASHRPGMPRLAGRLSGRLARRTIAISRHAANFAARTGIAPRERIRVVSYGIDVDAWRVTDAMREDARRAFGLTDGDVAFGVAGRLVEGKGHDLALEAILRARPRGLCLLIAGDGPLRGDIERQVDSLPPGRARVLGHVDDIGGFMAACDALVFPTQPGLGEGFGLAALEAMAAGRPVIATRAGALPEVVEDGVTGLIVGASPAALASAFDRLGEDPALRTTFGDAGAERARTRFSLVRMVEGTRAVYAEALTG